LLRVGRARGSVTLEANARHLLTDVWTSVGVVAAIGLVAVTGWEILDPLVALAVAGNIVWTGFRILRSSALGLMDTALPEEEREKIRQVVEQHCTGEIQYHALRTRQAGRRRFVSFHVLVPGNWTVHQGHAFLEKIEADIRAAVPQATVFTHLESLEDASSWDDTLLDR
jgi:cation diffusion facilitator family transporter